jgi:hypothetical protein
LRVGLARGSRRDIGCDPVVRDKKRLGLHGRHLGATGPDFNPRP